MNTTVLEDYFDASSDAKALREKNTVQQIYVKGM